MESTPLKFSRYLRTRPGALSLAIVILTATILGYFCVRTFFLPLQKSYPLDFSTAEWISSPDAPHGYFRKSLYLPANVIHAWIQVAAPDEYELFVNNVRVRDSIYFGVCNTGIHDLKPYLAEGRNTIAIHVTRTTYPGAAQLLVRGGYISPSSPAQEFHSDTTWKVSIIEVQDRGGLPWTSPDLDDSGWANAGSGQSDGRPKTILPLRFPPELVRALPTAAWISRPEVRASEAAFRREIQVPAGRVETWLQVAATGSYDVLINGRLVASRPLAAANGPLRRASTLILSPYNISSHLHRGRNTILIHVRSESGTPVMLASAVIAHKGGVNTLGTDEAWMSSIQREDSGGDWTTHATVVGQYGDDAWPVSREPLALAQQNLTNDFHSLAIWTVILLCSVCFVGTTWFLASRLWALPMHRPPATYGQRTPWAIAAWPWSFSHSCFWPMISGFPRIGASPLAWSSARL